MLNYVVHTINGIFAFKGRFRRDLEANNWHYYEKEDGTVIHFRKDHMVAVEGDIVESVKSSKITTISTGSEKVLASDA